MPPKKGKPKSPKNKPPSPPPVEVPVLAVEKCSFKFPPGPLPKVSPLCLNDEYCIRSTSIEDLLFTECLVPYKILPCDPNQSAGQGEPPLDALADSVSNKKSDTVDDSKKAGKKEKKEKKEKKPTKDKKKESKKPESATEVAKKPLLIRRGVPRKCFCCKRYPDRTQSELSSACEGCEKQIAVWMLKYHFTKLELGELLEAFFFFAHEDKPKVILPEEDTSTSKKGANKKGGKEKKSKDTDGTGKKDKADSSKKNQAGNTEDKADGATETQNPPEPPQLGLTRCTFSRCLRTIGQNPSELDLRAMFNMAGPEPIHLERYLDVLDCWSLRCLEEMEKDLWEAFKVLNCDSDEYVLEYQLRGFMACLGEPLDEEELDELFSMSVPPDECGRINICQLVSHLVHHQRHQVIFRPPPEPVAEVVEEIAAVVAVVPKKH